jgi:hypothetical protein
LDVGPLNLWPASKALRGAEKRNETDKIFTTYGEQINRVFFFLKKNRAVFLRGAGTCRCPDEPAHLRFLRTADPEVVKMLAIWFELD